MVKEIKPYAFVDRKGNKVTKDNYTAKSLKEPGKAYGFFYCNASDEQIKAELPQIKDMAQTPSELELTLTEGMDNLKGTKTLKSIAKQYAESPAMNYMLEATYPNGTNLDAAKELHQIFIQAYQSSLYSPEAKELFYGDIISKDKGKFVLYKD